MRSLAPFFVVIAALAQSPLSDLNNLPLAGSGVTLRTTTRLVDISALVVDKKGNPVTDLKKEDFEIYDEGKRQPIRMFATPAPLAAVPVEAPPPEPSSALSASPRIFSNHADQASRSNPTIFLIDEGPAKWEEKLFARGRIIRLLKQLPPGEQIGLYAPVPYGVGIAHEFTRDQSDLVRMIEQWNMGASNALLSLKSVQSAPRRMDNATGIDAHFYCNAAPALIAITASAIHVAGIPGHKTIIWISVGGATGSGPQNCHAEEEEAQHALNQANMTLYALDARGLQSVQPDAQISAGDLGCGAGCDSPRPVLNRLTTMTADALSGIGKDQAVMLDLADKAGGRAFVNTNDVTGALRVPFTDARSAYALGFYPESLKLDGKYHQLEVKLLAHPDLAIRYRRGYVDEPDDPKTQLRTALLSPLDSSAIALTAEMSSTETNYDVKLTVGLEGLDLQQQNGRWQGRIHVILAQKDENGQQFDYRDDTVQLDLKPETYAASRKTGVAYHLTAPRNPKSASLRVVVRDEAGNLGSVTIPQTKLLAR